MITRSTCVSASVAGDVLRCLGDKLRVVHGAGVAAVNGCALDEFGEILELVGAAQSIGADTCETQFTHRPRQRARETRHVGDRREIVKRVRFVGFKRDARGERFLAECPVGARLARASGTRASRMTSSEKLTRVTPKRPPFSMAACAASSSAAPRDAPITSAVAPGRRSCSAFFPTAKRLAAEGEEKKRNTRSAYQRAEMTQMRGRR